MSKVHEVTIVPAVPDSLKALEAIARNMYWSWQGQFVELFKRVDSSLWTGCGHNPVKFLASVSQQRLESLADNQGFLSELKRAAERLQSYLEGPRWFDRVCSETTKPVIAYFSAEFGIHECLPMYAGGLGILAGDYLKSASDLGVPLVGVGLLYQKGYFRQYLNADGFQQEAYIENDFYNAPIELVRRESGQPLTVSLEYPGRCVLAQIWCATVGRVKLYLLDTNVSENSSADRLITSSLYGGDREMRIRQEMMLGIGGFKALKALGNRANVFHLNEGHAAFVTLERIRELQNTAGVSFDEAVEATRAGNVFTMHTPLKAGLDEFRVELMDKYFGSYFGNLGINRTRFLALGRIFSDDDNEAFKMPVLALRLSGYVNGVSKLHGKISRGMWSGLWPGVPVNEVPIKSITNGVHVKSWLSDEMECLYESYFGSDWTEQITDKSMWQGVDQIPDEQLWQSHQRCKDRLIAFARRRLKAQIQRRGSYHSELNWAEEVLEPGALTVGFARRFAGYKRANLLFWDPQRLGRLLNDPGRPVQIIFAGKAHPKDKEGKEIIQQIIHFAREPQNRRRVVFLEDYDIELARALVQGVDLWLNNPRRPMEASGTSGMKAAINGALNMSTLDGWWCEGYTPEGGWAIGSEQIYEDADYQDMIEAQAIYNILENEAVPLFYTRSADNLPRAWIKRMKNSIKWITPRFNMRRMVGEYLRRFCTPAAAKMEYFTAGDMSRAKLLSRWKSNIRSAWSSLAINDVRVEVNNGQMNVPLNPNGSELKVGSELSVKVLVMLGKALPEDVSVELYHGQLDAWGNIKAGSVVRLGYQQDSEPTEGGQHWFSGSMTCRTAGRCGFAVRILPRHNDLINPYEMGLIFWEAAVSEAGK